MCEVISLEKSMLVSYLFCLSVFTLKITYYNNTVHHYVFKTGLPPFEAKKSA